MSYVMVTSLGRKCGFNEGREGSSLLAIQTKARAAGGGGQGREEPAYRGSDLDFNC